MFERTDWMTRLSLIGSGKTIRGTTGGSPQPTINAEYCKGKCNEDRGEPVQFRPAKRGQCGLLRCQTLNRELLARRWQHMDFEPKLDAGIWSSDPDIGKCADLASVDKILARHHLVVCCGVRHLHLLGSPNLSVCSIPAEYVSVAREDIERNECWCRGTCDEAEVETRRRGLCYRGYSRWCGPSAVGTVQESAEIG